MSDENHNSDVQDIPSPEQSVDSNSNENELMNNSSADDGIEFDAPEEEREAEREEENEEQ